MAKKKEPPLQPLRIPGGWIVKWNHFCEVDPQDASEDDYLSCLIEDIVAIYRWDDKVMVDLGWHGGPWPKGSYRVSVVVGDTAWNPAETIRTRSRAKVVTTMEKWLVQYLHDIPKPKTESEGKRRESR